MSKHSYNITPGPSNRRPDSETKFGGFGRALMTAADALFIPICPDLAAYRIKLRPILERVMGGSKIVSHLTIDREKLFKQAISFYKSDKKNCHTQLMITFEKGGIEEEGLDGSGLRREFYCSFFRECLYSTKNVMFVGSRRRMLPSNDMSMVQNGFFEALGKAIVASILNGDCGFPYLAPVVFYYLIDEDVTTHLTLEDVPDMDIKYLIDSLLKAQTDSEINEIIHIPEATVIDHIGWPTGQTYSMKTRDALVEHLIRWSLIEKRKSSLDKLKAGLNHMGFLDATKDTEHLKPLLVYSQQYSVTAAYLKDKLLPKVEELECSDESQRSSKQFMLDYLMNITDEEAESLFQFITGSIDPPVEEEAISVEFNNSKKSQKYPEAHTCLSRLVIPNGNKSLNEFNTSIRQAIDMAKQGFGNA
ncbi:hypothetical protein ACF0H5_004407 [Mactra antiquata]